MKNKLKWWEEVLYGPTPWMKRLSPLPYLEGSNTRLKRVELVMLFAPWVVAWFLFIALPVVIAASFCDLWNCITDYIKNGI